MRYFLFSVLLFVSVLSFGQNNNQAPATDSDSGKSIDELNEKESKTIVNDSIATKSQDEQYRRLEDEIEINSVNKKKSANKSSGYNTESSGKVAAESEKTIQSSQSATSNFKYSKAQSASQRSQRSPSASQQADMNEAVGYFEEKSPNSFEYHYFKYVSGNYDVSLFSHLAQAEKLRANNADVHVQMAAYYIIQSNKTEALSYIDKLIKANRLTESVLKYAEDILLSAPKNGTLITHGFDDSYATWYLQAKRNIRTDVKLISLDFMQSEYYRNEIKKKGFALPRSANIDVNYFETFCKLNSSKKISASLTMPKEYFKSIMPNVYIVGLVFEYHDASFDNFKSNENLWNNGLKKHLVNEASDEKAKQLSSNYLPMLLQMRKVYRQKNEQAKVDELDRAIDKIGAQCKKYEQVQKLKSAY